MTWNNIPPEVQGLIADQLSDKLDLARLCRVSKHFRDTALRFMYNTIHIKAEDEWQLADLSLAPLLRTLCEHPELLKYIKKVCISAPIHRNVLYRCLHLYERDSKYTEAYTGAYEEGCEEYDQECEDEVCSELGQEVALSDLGSRLIALLGQLRDNSLCSFSWDLGTCVPSELLGVSGYLLLKQNQIESLSLITDSWCQLNNGTNQTNRTIPELAGFTSLRSISWRGIHLRSDFLALRGALQANSKHLQILELDLVKWISAELYYYKDWNQDKSQHFLANEILQLGSKGQEVAFPSLRTLSLSGVSYHVAASGIALAFDFSKIRSLKLNKCPHVRNLLEAVLQAGQPIQLTSLELAIQEGNVGPSDPLIRFLSSFRGLKTLHLLTHDYQVNEELWETIFLHRSTLQQLVYHERPYQDERTTDQLILPWNNLNLRLSYVGLCCSLSELWVQDSSLRVLAKDTLTLLHIRRTGIDKYKRHMNYIRSPSDRSFYDKRLIEGRELRKFAAWAFGPHGFPRLQVLAYGDFSFGNRYAQQNTLLRRKLNSALNPTSYTNQAQNASFEVVRSEGWNRIDDTYREVLEACPVDYLYS